LHGPPNQRLNPTVNAERDTNANTPLNINHTSPRILRGGESSLRRVSRSPLGSRRSTYKFINRRVREFHSQASSADGFHLAVVQTNFQAKSAFGFTRASHG